MNDIEIENALRRYKSAIDEAEMLARKARNFRREAEADLYALAVETAKGAGIEIGTIVVDERGVRRIVDAIRGAVVTDPRTGVDTLEVSLRLPKLTKAGVASRKERYVWWASKLQQIVDDASLPTLSQDLPKFTLETDNA